MYCLSESYTRYFRDMEGRESDDNDKLAVFAHPLHVQNNRGETLDIPGIEVPAQLLSVFGGHGAYGKAVLAQLLLANPAMCPALTGLEAMQTGSGERASAIPYGIDPLIIGSGWKCSSNGDPLSGVFWTKEGRLHRVAIGRFEGLGPTRTIVHGQRTTFHAEAPITTVGTSFGGVFMAGGIYYVSDNKQHLLLGRAVPGSVPSYPLYGRASVWEGGIIGLYPPYDQITLGTHTYDNKLRTFSTLNGSSVFVFPD